MELYEPTHRKIEKEVLGRICFLKAKIGEFDTPLTKEDYKDRFRSRLEGDKSSKALTAYFEELVVREEELALIRNYDYFFRRNRCGRPDV